MKRYTLALHGGKGFSWQEMDEYAAGAWVRYEDVEKLQAELTAAKAMLARVFGKGCVHSWSAKGIPITDCALCDRNEPSCKLTSMTVSIDGTRPDWCPYLPIEKEVVK